MVVDEASLTGESDPVKKGGPGQECWVRSGTQVSDGPRLPLRALGFTVLHA